MISNITLIRMLQVSVSLLTPERLEKQTNTPSNPVFADESTKPQKGGKEKKMKIWFLGVSAAIATGLFPLQ